MKIIVITGPPYSGKGTQCEKIEKEFGYKQISLGELCRQEKTKGTDEGKIIDKQEETGSLVPNYIIKKLFTNALLENKDKDGVLIDGYPRTKQQVDDLFNILADNNLSIDGIYNIYVDEPTLLKRAEERAKTSDRKDDKDPKIHLNRIKIFNEITNPAIDYMNTKQSITNFSGKDSPEKVYYEIKKYL